MESSSGGGDQCHYGMDGGEIKEIYLATMVCTHIFNCLAVVATTAEQLKVGNYIGIANVVSFCVSTP